MPKNLPDIIIPHHNRWDLIGNCLKAIPMNYKVYVVRGFTFAQACNKGASLSQADRLLFLNDDVVLTPQVLKELEEHDEDIVGVPLRIPSRNATVYGMNMYWGMYGQAHLQTPSVKTALEFHDASRCQFPVVGACFTIKRKVFEDLGRFYEGYKNGGEDNELNLLAKERGYTFGYTKAVCNHFHSASEGRYDNDVPNHRLLSERFPKDRLEKIIGKNVDPSPLISIIIPTREVRGEPFCLKSIKDQTYKNLEIIIIRDIDKKGACWARNEGFKQSRGEYVFFCDDDIELKSLTIQIMLENLLYAKDSFVYCNYDRVGELRGAILGKPWSVPELVKDNYISTMSLIRRKDFPEGGFDESLKRFQDWDLWLTMAEQGKSGIHLNNIFFTAYYKRGGISCDPSTYNSSRQTVVDKHQSFINSIKSNSMPITSAGSVQRAVPQGEVKKEESVSSNIRAEIETNFFKQNDWKHLSLEELGLENDNSLKEIFVRDKLQTFDKENVSLILKEWVRVLEPNGRIVIVVKNLKKVMALYMQTWEKKYLDMIYGDTAKGENFKYGYTLDLLRPLMISAGFKEVRELMPSADYYSAQTDLMIEARK
jgi:glycosyltransferase involved in cell wall biosynthesis